MSEMQEIIVRLTEAERANADLREQLTSLQTVVSHQVAPSAPSPAPPTTFISQSADIAAVTADGLSGAVGIFSTSDSGLGMWTIGGGVPFPYGPPPVQAAGILAEGGPNCFAIYAKATQAGFFEGNVTVTGDVILAGADCAEEFDVAEAAEIEPGTVMVLDQEGMLRQSHQAYDKRVAGIISGAGNYRPGVVLDRQPARDNRAPLALVGKVYCKVDAQYAPIEVGDLLTTSPTSGHAMKADDPFKAFGSVIGKALRPLEAGQGMIPVLIALQ